LVQRSNSMFVKKIVFPLGTDDFLDFSVLKNQVNQAEKFEGIRVYMDDDHVIYPQMDDPFTFSKGVKIKGQLNIAKGMDGNQLEMNCSLLSTMRNLLIATVVIHFIFVMLVLILYMTNQISVDSIWFKALIVLPLFDLLTFLFIQASFDEQISRLSKFMLAQLEQYQK
jgi:hypothetical protein